jgi:hypothetical protein
MGEPCGRSICCRGGAPHESPCITVSPTPISPQTLDRGFVLGFLGHRRDVLVLRPGYGEGLSLLSQNVGGTTVSDESRDGPKGRRHMATKGRGPKQKQNENPREDPQTEAPEQAGEASGRDG